MSKPVWNWTAMGLAVLAALGCSNGGDTTASVAVEGQPFVLSSRPDGILSLTDAKAQVSASGRLSHLALAGVIGAGDHEPWDEGRAAFILSAADGAQDTGASDGPSDPTNPPPPPGEVPAEIHDARPDDLDDEGHDKDADHDLANQADQNAVDDHAGHDHAGHDHDNCPFCQKAVASQPLVIVQFVDPSGDVLATDSRRLFGLRKGQQVVVQGAGQLDSLGNLVVTATGIYMGD